ncbi:hypothetical protein [Ferrimonas sp. YFM]|uniref:hypothetical protein n=1 Tax=Ferrimonas sp. YFM TaxID=3028878 RepID=UPI0025739BDD|nr:hypothetical protein [Ferrimonas sp. YFM]BDY06067.1 hypothetical protein F0521_31080 [Ferrimonas sp. YFM]
MSMSAIHNGSQLIQQSQAQLDRDAHTIATAQVDSGSAQQENLKPVSAKPSVESALLSATQAPLYSAAGASVLRRSDEMLGNLLDTTA